MTEGNINDPLQAEVIRFHGDTALVLGAPGCGKTHILTQRVLWAHESLGVSYGDMLCLTFTNRAAREMKERVEQVVGSDALEQLFVGNLHRFCIRFLHDNELVPDDISIIDDVDQQDIITELAQDEGALSFRTWQVKAVTDQACRTFMESRGFPSHLIHYKSASAELLPLAERYMQFKHDHHVLDFDDVLVFTYWALCHPRQQPYLHASYGWIQVDEVQDLNPLQLAIIDKITAPEHPTVVYLGDERQAIYSFLGTHKQGMEQLRQRVGSHFYTLSTNYRSPIYLLDLLNDYATHVLGVSASLLPRSTNSLYLDDGITVARCATLAEQADVAAGLVRRLARVHPTERVGLLVRTNAEAEALSDMLNRRRVSHVKITHRDVFKSISFKTLFSYFSLAVNDLRWSDWSAMLFRTKVFQQKSLAERFVRKLRALALTPLDVVVEEAHRYGEAFCQAFDEEIVLFDTETTGLDYEHDDIIQIAAVKVRGGKVVEGSELDIIIATERDIPATLRDGLPNPMVEEYRRRSEGKIPHAAHEFFMSAQEAFAYFLTYMDGRPVMGHNVMFDVQMLENNLLRRTSHLAWKRPTCWDTLRLARLLDPFQRRHNLETLLKVYGLEGVNSHNAIDDVRATLSLARHCYQEMHQRLEEQRAFLANPIVMKVREAIEKRFMPIFRHTEALLNKREKVTPRTFTTELRWVHQQMVEQGFIDAIPLLGYMCTLFDQMVMGQQEANTLRQQLEQHLYELRTFNESDLFQNAITAERVYVMTIHKAKGLEFDNVVVYNVSHDVFPPAHLRNVDEMARLLYVALSRARRRVCVTSCGALSPFLSSSSEVMEHFQWITEEEKLELSANSSSDVETT